MPQFLATYLVPSGREIRERVLGPTPDVVRTTLRARGFFPTRISPLKTQQRRLRIPPKTVAAVLRQLAMQMRAGVTELDAVASLKDGHSSAKVRSFLGEIYTSLSVADASFSAALGAFPGVMPAHLRAIIAAADGSGPQRMAERLGDVADWLLFTEKIKRTLRKATAYPALLIMMSLVYLAFFVTWFIPRFKGLVTSFGMPLPGYTQAILAGSAWARDNGLLLLLAIGASVAAWTTVRKVELLASTVDHTVLRIPIYRRVYRGIVTCQFARNYRALQAGGTPAHECLQHCTEMFGNRAARAEIRRLHREVKDGATLGTALRRSDYFPAEAVSIITTAETTGNLSEALRVVAEQYEEETREAVDTALGLLGPLLIVATASLVGAVLVGLFLPLSKMFEYIQ